MSTASIESLGHRASHKRMRRGWSTLTVAFLVALVTSICVLPMRTAFADQVLELPQAPARAASSDTSRDASRYVPDDVAPKPAPHRRAMAPMPAGLGSIDDYESQDGSSSSSGIAGAGLSPRIDPNRNGDALANEVILGALVIGLFAMEVHAAHQHHRR
jgi:hypothetical protein